MGALNSWASGIVASVIIATIIEMILPEGKNKKYIKTIIGIFVLFAIISPVITKFSKGDIDLGAILASSSNVSDYSEKTKSINTDNMVLDTYKEKLKTEITKKIEEKGYAVNSLNIEISSKEESYGYIKSISIDVQEKEEKGQISMVNEIKIDVNSKEKTQEKKSISEAKIEEIREYLAESYQIDKNNIIIS